MGSPPIARSVRNDNALDDTVVHGLTVSREFENKACFARDSPVVIGSSGDRRDKAGLEFLEPDLHVSICPDCGDTFRYPLRVVFVGRIRNFKLGYRSPPTARCVLEVKAQ